MSINIKYNSNKENGSMPRHARSICETGIYHVMLRGNERKKIFLDEYDRSRFINTTFDKISEENSEIYAYCLMSNHVHLLIGEFNNNLSRLMKRINVSYVYYFNKKYKRIGHLFQDRFKSENVDNEPYMLEVIRYIHNNPVKAGIVRNPRDYKWSSYNDYITTNMMSKLSVDKVLDLFGENTLDSLEQFIDFSNKPSNIEIIEYDDKTLIEKRQEKILSASCVLRDYLFKNGIKDKDLINDGNSEFRIEIIKKLKQKYDLSIRQMEEVTGIGRSTVAKVFNNMDDDDS